MGNNFAFQHPIRQQTSETVRNAYTKSSWKSCRLYGETQVATGPLNILSQSNISIFPNLNNFNHFDEMNSIVKGKLITLKGDKAYNYFSQILFDSVISLYKSWQ